VTDLWTEVSTPTITAGDDTNNYWQWSTANARPFSDSTLELSKDKTVKVMGASFVWKTTNGDSTANAGEVQGGA